MFHSLVIGATSNRFAVIKIASIVLALLLFSFSISPVLANPERAPELETITFIDVFRPTNEAAPPADGDGSCTAQSSSYKTIRGGIHWQNFPVTYFIAGKPSAGDIAAVVNAVESWDVEEHPVGQFFQKVDVEPPGGADVVVSWASIDGPSGTLAVTGISFNPATKEIVRATVTFDSDDTWTNQPPTISCDDQAGGHDVENVGAHEFGHVVGLAHVNDDSNLTMFTFLTQPGETMKRSLGPGDRDGIFALYGGPSGGGDDGDGGNSCPPGHARRNLC